MSMDAELEVFDACDREFVSTIPAVTIAPLEEWTTRDGEKIHPSSMDDTHLVNSVNLVLRRQGEKHDLLRARTCAPVLCDQLEQRGASSACFRVMLQQMQQRGIFKVNLKMPWQFEVPVRGAACP